MWRNTRGKESYRRTTTFYTTKGLKQGCPLSPILFALYIYDIEEILRKVQSKGCVVGKNKIYSQAYADDMAVVAKEHRDMKEMLKTLEKYFKKRDLIPNISKTKMVVFSLGGRKSKHCWEWKWNEQPIEEVQEFKYLGFLFRASGKTNTHIKALKSEAVKKLGRIWGMAERLFPGNFKIRMHMYDSLIASGMMYGSEIYGWKRYDEIESVQRKYVKWTLGVDGRTKNEIIMEEANRLPHCANTAKRAMKFEEKSLMGNNEILQDCVKWNRKYHLERRGFIQGIGWGQEFEEMMRGQPNWIEDAIKITTDNYYQNIYNKLRGSTYERLRPIQLPHYLEKNNPKYKIIARFRCGNEENAGKSWLGKVDCRICGTEAETINHMIETCVPSEWELERLMSASGKGIKWMERVLESRWDFNDNV